MNEIIFAPEGLMTQDYDLFRGETKIGRLTYTVFGSEDAFLLDNESFEVETQGFGERSFVVTQGSRSLLTAQVEGILNWKMNVTYEGLVISLKPSLWANSEMRVLSGEAEVGRIERTGLFSRKGQSHLPDDLPLGVVGFLLWATILHWRQTSSGGE